ncbi:hypothetical protein [Candidatus Endomicrobiellum devescovinae]|jgi:hypothetical protein|uniref:hypothetical protein n=1 Tax=Candidatus Endomicrobiellum devescovinae TaxID=3242322 RepID=UPI00283832A0|nr:hypothetical protein [Endomicrobium sp.]
MKLKVLVVLISAVVFSNVVEAKYYKLKPELDIEKLEADMFIKKNDYRMKAAKDDESAPTALVDWQYAAGVYVKALKDIRNFRILYSRVRRALKSGAPTVDELKQKLINDYLIDSDVSDDTEGRVNL